MDRLEKFDWIFLNYLIRWVKLIPVISNNFIMNWTHLIHCKTFQEWMNHYKKKYRRVLLKKKKKKMQICILAYFKLYFCMTNYPYTPLHTLLKIKIPKEGFRNDETIYYKTRNIQTLRKYLLYIISDRYSFVNI